MRKQYEFIDVNLNAVYDSLPSWLKVILITVNTDNGKVQLDHVYRFT